MAFLFMEMSMGMNMEMSMGMNMKMKKNMRSMVRKEFSQLQTLKVSLSKVLIM